MSQFSSKHEDLRVKKGEEVPPQKGANNFLQHLVKILHLCYLNVCKIKSNFYKVYILIVASKISKLEFI